MFGPKKATPPTTGILTREGTRERGEYLFMGWLSLGDATHSQGERDVPVGAANQWEQEEDSVNKGRRRGGEVVEA